MFADRLSVARFVDTERANTSVRLVHDIAADPADLIGHLFVADASGLGSRGFEFLEGCPGARAADHIEVHCILLEVRRCSPVTGPVVAGHVGTMRLVRANVLTAGCVISSRLS